MKKLFNPIAHFDERKLLAVGLASVVLNLGLSYFFGFKMISILKFAPSASGSGVLAFYILRAYAVAIAALYLYGLLINRKTRFLDIVNTVLIAIIPAILVNPIQKIPVFAKILERMLKAPLEVLPADLTMMLLLALVMLPFIVYKIVLLLNGFKTATHLKAWYHVVLFFVILLAIASFTPYIFKL